MSKKDVNSLLDAIADSSEVRNYHNLQWSGSFSDYLELVLEDPRIIRNAHQRVHDMISSHGQEEFTQFKERLIKYGFFADPFNDGHDAIFGIEKQLMQLVSHFKSAAFNFGTEKRVLLLHGPVGSAKSTIARLLKHGIESYSKSDDGRMFTFGWKIKDEVTGADVIWSPMNEDPIKLIPEDARHKLLDQLNEKSDLPYKLRVEGNLDPLSRKIMADLLAENDGDWRAVVEKHVVVKRMIISEKDRIGIGTFQPKDEKNQDATEL
ncbi:MAG: PrkA family serine protein kinase, partial [Planctomycetota bacterium]